ncbi:PTS sugar transporter subunit IIC [Gemmatimonadota bacterium]
MTLMGGLLALDGTSLGQFMISRPLVAGTLTGWVMGDPLLGLLVGGILEVYFIPVFPVGGSDFPEGGPPTVVAVATASTLAGAEGIALGIFLGLLWSQFGAATVAALRKVNGRLVPDSDGGEVRPSRIVLAHFGGMFLDFLRGCVLTLGGLALGLQAHHLPAGAWPLGVAGTLGLLAVGASVPAGAFVASLGGWRRRGVLFGAGLLGFLAAGLIL